MQKFAPLLVLLTCSALAGGGNAPLPSAEQLKIGVQDNTKAAQIRVVVRSAKGRVLWQTQIDGQLGGRKDQKSWGVQGGTLWIAVLRGVQNWHTDNLGYRLSDGKKLWDMGNVNLPLAQAGSELLLEGLGPEAYPDVREKHLYVVQAKTGLSRWLVFKIPERKDCGDINDYSYNAQETLKTWADPQFFYATHKDKCGMFTARFNWHLPDTQTPLLTATRPVVKASELTFQFLSLALDDTPRLLLQAFRHNETLWQLELRGELSETQEGVNWGWDRDGKTLWVRTSQRSYRLDGLNGRILEEKGLGGH